MCKQLRRYAGNMQHVQRRPHSRCRQSCKGLLRYFRGKFSFFARQTRRLFAPQTAYWAHLCVQHAFQLTLTLQKLRHKTESATSAHCTNCSSNNNNSSKNSSKKIFKHFVSDCETDACMCVCVDVRACADKLRATNAAATVARRSPCTTYSSLGMYN